MQQFSKGKLQRKNPDNMIRKAYKKRQFTNALTMFLMAGCVVQFSKGYKESNRHIQ